MSCSLYSDNNISSMVNEDFNSASTKIIKNVVTAIIDFCNDVIEKHIDDTLEQATIMSVRKVLSAKKREAITRHITNLDKFEEICAIVEKMPAAGWTLALIRGLKMLKLVRSFSDVKFLAGFVFLIGTIFSILGALSWISKKVAEKIELVLQTILDICQKKDFERLDSLDGVDDIDDLDAFIDSDSTLLDDFVDSDGLDESLRSAEYIVLLEHLKNLSINSGFLNESIRLADKKPAKEEWRLIDHPAVEPNKYEVSNYGRVQNLSFSNIPGKIKEVTYGRYHINGEKRVALAKPGGMPTETFSVARLVARAFFPGFKESMRVFNIADDPFDCSIENIVIERSSADRRLNRRHGQQVVLVDKKNKVSYLFNSVSICVEVLDVPLVSFRVALGRDDHYYAKIGYYIFYKDDYDLQSEFADYELIDMRE